MVTAAMYDNVIRSWRRCNSRNRLWAASVHDDFSLRVSVLQIADGLGDLAQRVGSVDGRRELSGFEELPKESHGFLFVRPRNAHVRRLFHVAFFSILLDVLIDKYWVPIGVDCDGARRPRGRLVGFGH